MNLRLSALATILLMGAATGAHAGLVDLSIQSGSQLNFTPNTASNLALTTAKTTGVAGVANGTYSITGASLNLNSGSPAFTITNLGPTTVTGNLSFVSSMSDGSGGTILTENAVIASNPSYPGYTTGTLTLDYGLSGSIKSGDFILVNSVPEPASLAMTALGLVGALAGFTLKRREAARI